MAVFDIFLLVVVVLAGISGYRRGFIIEIFSLLAFFIGIFLALKLTFPVTMKFFGDYKAFWLIALVVFVTLFFIVVRLANFLANFIKKLIDFTIVGILDNLLGMVFSLIKYLFILSSSIWVLSSTNIQLPEDWLDNSDFYELVASISPKIVEFVSSMIPWFQDIIESMDMNFIVMNQNN